MPFVVTIDGPAGTGKSSVSRQAALELGYYYVDTGAIYRALAYVAYDKGIDDSNEDSLLNCIGELHFQMDDKQKSLQIQYDGQTLTNNLRSEKISQLASIISSHKKVRQKLISVQRSLISKKAKGIIFEGRDIGTVIFPKAPLKIFITADTHTRAQRRFNELKKNRSDISFDHVLSELERRDERDKNRVHAPMHRAKDAYIIDTSYLAFDQVVSKIIEYVNKTHSPVKEEQELW